MLSALPFIHHAKVPQATQCMILDAGKFIRVRKVNSRDTGFSAFVVEDAFGSTRHVGSQILKKDQSPALIVEEAPLIEIDFGENFFHHNSLSIKETQSGDLFYFDEANQLTPLSLDDEHEVWVPVTLDEAADLDDFDYDIDEITQMNERINEEED